MESDSPIQAQLAAPSVVMDADTSPDGGKADADSQNVMHSRMTVFAMLFLVTGALGIPLLWMSPKFSNTERVVWAIVVTVYTAMLIFVAGAIVMWSWRQIFG